ncbi:MAG: AraC family transcriptional regulator [Planctomycetes bacterium]|nr:AraC family transcriptional regulator [Planctomycetota bacterium]
MSSGPVLHRRQFAATGDFHLRVLVAGWCELGPWWSGRTGASPLWRLYANDGPGAVLTLADGEEVALDPRHVWLLPAGMAYRNRTRAAVGHHWIHFDPLGLSPGGVRALAGRPLAVALDPALTALCAALRATACAPAADDLTLRCQAKALVYTAMAGWWSGLDHAARTRLLLAAADPGLAPALARIESDLAAPLYNEALARACALSASAFVRRFRAATGLSPAQFVLERRIARAAERLVMEDAAIDAIADQGGFSDRYYFTRVFTRRMGVSPAAYRSGHGAGAPGRS